MFAQGQTTLADEITLPAGDIKNSPVDLYKSGNVVAPENNLTLGNIRLLQEEDAAAQTPINNGIYTLTPAMADEYDYKTDTVNPDGSVTTNYYKITLNTSNAATSENITWTQAEASGANTVAVTLPNNEVVYMEYSYASPDGYSTTTSRVTSPSAANTTKMVFSGINNTSTVTGSNSSGGSSTRYGTDQTKTGTDSSYTYTDGSYPTASTSVTANSDISASASANASYSRSSYGGALENSSSSAVDITADFEGNSVSQTVTAGRATGGTARAYAGDATAYGGNATASGSYTPAANATTSASQSANARTYASASADATASAEATATGNAYSYGGAIANKSGAKLGNITGNFVGNSSNAHGKGGSASGGNAYAYGGTATAVGGSASATASTNNTRTGTYWQQLDCNASAYASASSSASTSAEGRAYASASANGYGYAYGGAISNEGTIGNIKGDFVNNKAYAAATRGSASGGYAYANSGTCNVTEGSASANASASASVTLDAANRNAYISERTRYVLEDGTVVSPGTEGATEQTYWYDSYTGTTHYDKKPVFSDRTYSSGSSSSAPYTDENGNKKTYDSDNSTTYHPDTSSYWAKTDTSASGTVSTSTGYYTGESSSSSTSAYAYARGGAIYNAGSRIIGTITGNFTGNYALAEANNTTEAYGGAIYSEGTIGKITGDFTGNYIQAKNATYGGAIYNTGTLSGLSGNFTNNFINNTASGSAYGGAIYNTSTITAIDAGSVFSGNYAATASGGSAQGGALYNSGAGMGDINADFLSNYVQTNSNPYGGAIFNSNTIKSISGNFSNNYANAKSSNAYGGAIYNTKTITNGITDSTFSGNYAQANSGTVQGGAIYNNSTSALNISADFVNNRAEVVSSGSVYGGAIYNQNTGALNITSNFSGNYVFNPSGSAMGGAFYNTGSGVINITSNFSGNYVKNVSSTIQGGAFWNNGANVGTISGDFTGNYAESAVTPYGGAIYNAGTIKIITGNFKENYVNSTGSSAYGGAIYNNTTISTAIQNAEFRGNYAQAASGTVRGGAIYNNSTISGGLINTSFYDNYAKVDSGTAAQGGAIYSLQNLTIFANAGTSKFSGNYVQDASGTKDYQAIYIDSSSRTLTLNAQNNGIIEFDDYITGASGYKVTLTGNTTGKIIFNSDNAIRNATVTLSGANLTFAENSFAYNTTYLNTTGNAYLALNDGKVTNYNINRLTSNTNSKWDIDIDMSNKTGDTLKTLTNSSGTVFINSINVIGAPSEGANTIKILDTQNSNLKLSLNSALTGRKLLSTVDNSYTEEIKVDTNWDDIYRYLDEQIEIYGEYALATTTTTYDSIKYTVTTKVLGTGLNVSGDTLMLWNQSDLAEKNFNFDSEGNIYTVGSNLGSTKGSVINVNGIANIDAKSTINMNGKTGFVQDSASTLNLSNVNITGALNSEGSVINASSADSITNLNNVTIADSNSTSAVKNAGTLNVVNGTNTLNSGISGTGATNINNGSTLTIGEGKSINQNTVNVNNGILNVSDSGKINANLNISTTGDANLSASSITSAVANDGDLNLRGGVLSSVVSGSGLTNITGTVISNAAINQGMNVSGDFTINASNVGGAISNSGAVNLGGGTLNNTVYGTGSTNVTGTVTSNAAINQNINITGALTSDADNVGGAVENSGSLTLTSGTLVSAVQGSGHTYITGDVSANSLIAQEISIATGANLTASASNIGGSVSNSENLTLSGGTLAHSVSGSGTTYINGDVVGNAAINQAINVTGSLNTNADNIGGLVTNTNQLTITGGTLSQTINGSGTTNITGTVQGNAAMNQALNITGSLTANADNIGGAVANANDLTLTGGTLSHAVSGIGTTTVTGGVVNNETIAQDVTISVAGNLTNNNDIGNVRNSGILTSTAEHLTGTIENNLTLNLSGTLGKTVSGNGTTYVASGLTFADGAKINSVLNLSSGAALTTTGTADSAYSAGSITGGGDVNVSTGTLTVRNDALVNSFTNTSTAHILGSLSASGNVITSGNFDVTGSFSSDNLTNDGEAVVSGNLETKNNLQNTGDLTVFGQVVSKDVNNTGTVIFKDGANTQNFKNDGTAYITGNLNAKDIVNSERKIFGITGNVEAANVTNNGDMDVGGNLIVQQIIRNTGNLDITGYVSAQEVINSGELNIGDEANVSITGDLTATEDITTSGILHVIGSVNAKDLTNQGTLTAGKNADVTVLTNELDSVVKITGNLSAAEDIKNRGTLNVTGSVTGKNITNNNIVQIETDLTATETLTNSDKLTVTGHVNAGTVSNTGTLTVKNGADFNTFTNDANAILTGTVNTNELTNNGEMSVSGSLNAETDITNTSVLTVSESIIAKGEILNTETLDVTGSVSGKNITNEGTAEIEGDITSSAKLTNKNSLTTAGHLSAAEATNTGTLVVKSGADIDYFTNEGTAKFTGTVSTKELENNADMNVAGSLNAQTDITNTSELTVTENVTAQGNIFNTQNMKVTGSVRGNEISNEGTMSIGENLTAVTKLTNKSEMTVDGALNTDNASNTGTLIVRNGSVFTDFINENAAYIYNGMEAGFVNNIGSLNLNGGIIDVDNISNTSTINISDASFMLNEKITGNGNINITNSTFSANNIIDNQDITLTGSILNLGDNSDILKTSVVQTSGATVNTADGKYVNYNIKELNSFEDTRYSIDVTLNKDEQKADTFTLENGGSGKIFISTINVGTNIINDCDENENYIIQIIKSSTENAPELDYDRSKVLNQASANMSSDIIFAKDFGLASTTTTNDSLEIRGLKDTFGEWADFVTGEDKSFTFVNGSTSILSRDVAEIYGDNLLITGDGGILDANNKVFLSQVNTNQNITISGLTIKNSPGSTEINGILNLDNINTNKEFTNNNILNISGTTTLGNLTNNAAISVTGELLTMSDFINKGVFESTADVKANDVLNDSVINLEGSFSSETLTNNIGGSVKVTENLGSKNISNAGDLEVGGNLIAAEKLANTEKLQVEGSVVSKEFTNNGDANIKNDVITDILANNNTLETNGNISVKETLTNTGELIVTASLSSKEILNENSIKINNDLQAEIITNNKNLDIFGNMAVSDKITNTGSININGSASADEIVNNGVITLGDLSVDEKTGRVTINNINNSGTLNLNNSQANVGTIKTDTTGNLNLSNTVLTPLGVVENQNINASNSTINAGNPYNLVNNSVSLSSSTLNLGPLTLNPVHFNKIEMNNSTINIPYSDVDFSTASMGKITTDEFLQTGENSVINLNAIHTLNLPDRSTNMISIPFADTSFSNNVQYHGQDTVYSAIFQYGVTYDYKTGNMVFVRGGHYNPDTGEIDASTNPSDIFDPSILASSVASQAGATATMNQTFNYAFQHSDNFMLMPSMTRLSEINRNKYAIVGDQFIRPRQEGSMWYKPYANFETVPLKNGPKVHNTVYGSMIGFDAPLKEHKYGWVSALTGYLGYNGANMKYKGINSVQSGGLLGGTMTLYRGNFFNATTLSAGASVAENSTMYGRENPVMLLAGIANKMGYNMEFKGGSFIVQPNLLLTYTYVNTFDYRNAAGVTINSDALNVFQIAPGLKLIANTKNGWQPYFAVNMIWNVLDKQKITVENIRLPEMSIEPYVQYGLGLQKTYKENFIAFTQAMVQHGGRNGVALTAGLRWNIGKKPYVEKVQKETDSFVNVANKKTKNPTKTNKKSDKIKKTPLKTPHPTPQNKTQPPNYDSRFILPEKDTSKSKSNDKHSNSDKDIFKQLYSE